MISVNNITRGSTGFAGILIHIADLYSPARLASLTELDEEEDLRHNIHG